MLVSYPHCGYLDILLETVLTELGVSFVPPPANTVRTLSLGVRYSPESVCLPYKLMLGNFVEAAELGADVMLTTSNRGICRLGYYHIGQAATLHELGYKDVKFVALESHTLWGVWQVVQRLKRVSVRRVVGAFHLGLAKLRAVERMEELSYKARPLEAQRGQTSSLLAAAVKTAQEADTTKGASHAERDFREAIANMEVKRLGYRPSRVRIVGEFYVVLEPFSNMDIAVQLGYLGAEADRSIYLADWTYAAFLPWAKCNTAHHLARPYLSRDIGGDGWESVSEKVSPKGDVTDGIVHIGPFQCIPETVASSIMATMKGRPTLHLTFDEQTSRVGVTTRLEAFVDTLRQRRPRP